MPGLSASEMAPEELRAGEVIEYYSRAFVCGDRRGYRRAVVTRVDGGADVDFPITVDTEEVIPPDMMLKRVAHRFSIPLKAGGSKWRKLRTFDLVTGTFSAETRASALNKALEGAVAAAFDAVRDGYRDASEEIVPETPQNSACSSPDAESNPDHMRSPRTPMRSGSPTASAAEDSTRSKECSPSEGIGAESSLRQIIDLVSPGEESRTLSNAESGRPSKEEVAAYVLAIPNRHARAKIRHQAKKKRAQWHVPRSRKRRHLAKCAITKSGSAIYHAKTFKAAIFKNLQSSPEVQEHLENLHTRRTTYQYSAQKASRNLLRAVPWPAEIQRITSCKRNGVKFPDIGHFDPCQCMGDCFWDSCSNVASLSFCTPKYCNLGARCSNAPRTLSTLQLFDTGRVGLGVYTATDLDVGDVLGEYCGELTEFPAVVEGQPPVAVKENSGYTLLYNAKSVNKNYVYVDALRCGSITRFLSHSCEPNAAFVEQQTRSRVRVLVKMIKNVKAGAQVTVHYGNERWFKCACDRCWPHRVVEDTDSEEE
uniref:SET domain-containing protein n=1 Tax=Phytophthora ramorum TaxID=164328 RepID=H3GY83_PHYRM